MLTSRTTNVKAYFSKNAPILFWSIVAVLVSAALLLIVQFFNTAKLFPLIGQDIAFSNTISVSGEGEAVAVPDTALFTFAVIREAETSGEAQREVTQQMNSLLALLKDEGIPDRNIKTTNYNIVPRYEFREPSADARFPAPRGERVLVGFEVSHWVEVRLDDIDRAGSILSLLGSRGADNVSNMRLNVDDDEAVAREARQKAINDAKKKAKSIADDLGVRLVRIVGFNESGGAIPFFRGDTRVTLEESATVPVPEIPTGENKITVRVHITYAIE